VTARLRAVTPGFLDRKAGFGRRRMLAGRPPAVPPGRNPRESLPFLTFFTKFVALRRWSD